MKHPVHHDYSLVGSYMLTLYTAAHYPHLGILNPEPQPVILLSGLGQEISYVIPRRIMLRYRNIVLSKLSILPDHIDMIVHVIKDFPQGQHLGKLVTDIRKVCNKIYWSAYGPHGVPLFENGYTDCQLLDHLVNDWEAYIDAAPQQLAIKKSLDDPLHDHSFFTSIHDIVLLGQRCQIVGNRFLLGIPDKSLISAQGIENFIDYQHLQNQCFHTGDRGGVLITPALDPKEIRILTEARRQCHNIIWLRPVSFPLDYQPIDWPGTNCHNGHLLEISFWPPGFSKRDFSTAHHNFLYTMANSLLHLPPILP